MACLVCLLGLHRPRKREMWVLWTFSGRPIYSHLALRVGYCTERVVNGQKKIGEANGMLSLPIVPTQVTLRGNVGSPNAPIEAQLFTFGPRGQGIAPRGS